MSVEVRVPNLGESVVEATVGRWLKVEGDVIKNGESLVELETDKVNVEVPSDHDGVLQKISHKEGETVNVGDILALIDAAYSDANFVAKNASSQNGEARSESDGDAHITPIAKRLAEENHLDIGKITGSGPNGRIVKEDVVHYMDNREAGENKPPVSLAEPPPERIRLQELSIPAKVSISPSVVIQSEPREEERFRMSRRRQTIASRLVEARHAAAMLTTFNEIDMTAVMDVRKRRKDSFKERHGVGLGFMSFFTKAAIGALRSFPYLNAEIQGDEIVLKRYYDIGIAVGVEEGLVVPVVRDADKLSFAEIEKKISELAGKARDGKLSISELQGGTFTITNGGVYGSLMSTPILNPPQVGILGMHKIEERPVAMNGQVVIRPMMYAAVTYDHRIVDGGDAVRFLVRIKELVEDPESLLLEG
jgi:2-oxoglutarate dehydrogenase E2 component (dihydrolipoamide succinyltransferase)